MTCRFRLEAAFGARWYTDLTDPALVWTDLTDRVYNDPEPSWKRGRTTAGMDMARTPQPGEFTARLKSRDGALTPDNPASPYYPEVQPGLPIRWSVFDGSTWQVEFTGYLTNVDPVLANWIETDPSDVDGEGRLVSRIDWTQVDLTVTDGWSRVVQAGPRLAYVDRILSDLASPRPVELVLDTETHARVELRESTGVTAWTAANVPNARDAWGVGWWELDAGGVADWSVPGAATVLAEVGRGELYTGTAGLYGTVGTSAGFASDRFGGGLQVLDALVPQKVSATCDGRYNLTRQQITAGRPPAQLLPASAYDPVSVAASGWSGPGLSVVGVPSWVQGRLALDPATGTRSPAAGYPAAAFTATSAGTYVGPSVPVTAGKWYAAQAQFSAVTAQVTLAVWWFNASGSPISTSAAATAGSGNAQVTAGVVQAPAGAVSASLLVTTTSGAAVTFYAPGLYTAVPTGISGTPWAAPARWWPAGASDEVWVFGQWPGGSNLFGLDVGVDGEWLHFAAAVPGLGDGAPHMVAWNVEPGVDGVPTVWVDGVAVAGSWEVSASRPAGVLAWYPSLGLGAGVATTSGLDGSGNLIVSGGPALSGVTVHMALTGTPFAVGLPGAALVARWMGPYGAPGVWPQPVTAGGTTDASMDTLLDGLGWPRAMRSLEPGSAYLPISWARMVGNDDGTAATAPGDYGSDVTALASAEFGWADVDGNGFLRWLPRGWYDPDSDGLAAAVAAFHWSAAASGTITYTTALTQQMGEDDVINRVTASVGDGSALYVGAASVREDFDSQDRIGIRAGVFNNPAWTSQADTDSVTAEVIGLYGHARLLATQVTVRCYGADDPFLAPMLALQPGDPVAVTVPRAPAADQTLSCLVLSVAATTDGLVTTFTVGLGACPVPVVVPLFPDVDLYPALDLYPAGA